MTELAGLLVRSVQNEGFPLAGIVELRFLAADENWQRCLAAYQSWLDQGYCGDMEYLRRGLSRRRDPAQVLKGAKSVLSVAMPYSPIRGCVGGPRFASCLGSPDYHADIRDRLERAMGKALAEWRSRGGALFKWKVTVDTSAVLEKYFAAAAGLGFIGKNGLLITDQYGSYVGLGEVVLDQEMDRPCPPRPVESRCGECTLCLSSCPNGAWTAPRILDARRCISYLTLEKKKGLGAEEDLHGWAAGCDLCQLCCPLNRSVPFSSGMTGVPAITWDEALDRPAQLWAAAIKGTAIERLGPDRLQRNVRSAFKSVSEHGGKKGP